MRRYELLRWAGSVLLLALLVSPSWAQEPTTPAPRPGDTLGWYVVRPGDTLEAITKLYLGTPLLWRENWRLNPGIQDPHFLRIGQRIRVIVHRDLPGRTAEIETVSRKVDEKPHPNPWIPAREGDLLKRRDGLRTHHRSSAGLRFGDGLRLVVTEDSLVFLNELDMDVLGRTQDGIEVVQGRADLNLHSAGRTKGSIEVLVGSARAEPRPGPAGTGSSRFARGENGGAQVMVFAGRTEVASAGTKLEVPEGMGTRVPEGEPPAPPEKLLPAPVLNSPPAGWSAPWANPLLGWSAVSEADSYTVEIFRDAQGTRLVERKTGVHGSSWAPGKLPRGRVYWRVTAVAASGLDGYPARLRPLEVASGAADVEPPVVVAVPVTGIRVSGDTTVAAPSGRLRLESHDDLSGVESVVFRWDHGGWRSPGDGTVRVPEAPGPHLLEFQARDRWGRRSEVWKVPVEVEGVAPPPPTVRRRPALAGGGAE